MARQPSEPGLRRCEMASADDEPGAGHEQRGPQQCLYFDLSRSSGQAKRIERDSERELRRDDEDDGPRRAEMTITEHAREDEERAEQPRHDEPRFRLRDDLGGKTGTRSNCLDRGKYDQSNGGIDDEGAGE